MRAALWQLRLVWITCAIGPSKYFGLRPRSLNPALYTTFKFLDFVVFTLLGYFSFLGTWLWRASQKWPLLCRALPQLSQLWLTVLFCVNRWYATCLLGLTADLVAVWMWELNSVVYWRFCSLPVTEPLCDWLSCHCIHRSLNETLGRSRSFNSKARRGHQCCISVFLLKVVFSLQSRCRA